MPAPAELVTQTYLLGYLSDLGLTPGQLAALPALAAAASQAVRRYCNRVFTAQAFDELYTVDPPDDRVTLRQFPVLSVDRCATGATPVVEVWNADPNAARATAALAASGDALTGLVATGLTLTRWSSGAKAVTAVALTDGMTAAALAAAVNGAGGSWAAQAAPGYELWPAADLRPPQGAYPALGTNRAGFCVHADDLAFDLDEERGYLDLGTASLSAADSPRWGPGPGGEVNAARSYGGRNGVRVVYAAGFAAVPADVQQYTAEAVKAALQRFQTDSTLKSETDGVLAWASRDELLPLPREVMVGLSPWVNRRAG